MMRARPLLLALALDSGAAVQASGPEDAANVFAARLLAAEHGDAAAQRAAAQGDAEAMAQLGSMTLNGAGAAQDDAVAVALFRQAAALGNALAKSNLGWCLEQGRGVARDEAGAAALRRRPRCSNARWPSALRIGSTSSRR